MDIEVKKRVLHKIPYGLFILTSRHESDIGAGSVSWLSQASFDPPLVILALKKDSRLHGCAEKSKVIACCLLGKNQKDMAAAFFGATKLQGEKLNGYAYELGKATKCPILLDSPGWFEMQVIDIKKRGDHSVFLCEVVGVGLKREEDQLLLQDTPWQYGG